MKEMVAFYKKNPKAGEFNGGYAKMDEIIDTVYISKNGQTIELTSEESMEIYNLIKNPASPKWEK